MLALPVTASLRLSAFRSAMAGAIPNLESGFPKGIIENSYEEISDQLRGALLKIENETELLEQDNLARGELIDSVRVPSTFKDDGKSQYWESDVDRLACEFSDHDPPEYWGNINPDAAGFITRSNKYPWMPSDVSSEEFLF